MASTALLREVGPRAFNSGDQPRGSETSKSLIQGTLREDEATSVMCPMKGLAMVVSLHCPARANRGLLSYWRGVSALAEQVRDLGKVMSPLVASLPP